MKGAEDKRSKRRIRLGGNARYVFSGVGDIVFPWCLGLLVHRERRVGGMFELPRAGLDYDFFFSASTPLLSPFLLRAFVPV